MTLKEFVVTIENTGIDWGNRNKILVCLMNYAGAKPLSSVSKSGSQNAISESTASSWISGKKNRSKNNKRYFSTDNFLTDGRIKKENAYKFFVDGSSGTKWKIVQKAFREKHFGDDSIIIDTETDDFEKFNYSFWSQFADIINVDMWDCIDETEGNKSSKNGMKDTELCQEMMEIFQDAYEKGDLANFIPDEWNKLLDSRNERDALQIREIEYDGDGFKITNSYFAFDSDEKLVNFMKVCETNGKSIMIKENSSMEKGNQLVGDSLTVFHDKYGHPIIRDYSSYVTDIFAKSSLSVVNAIIDEEGRVLAEDNFCFIDSKISMFSGVNYFIGRVEFEVCKKYDSVGGDMARSVYNRIRCYKEALEKFRDDLKRLRDLKREKDVFFEKIETNIQFSDIPRYPFAYAYLNIDEGTEIENRLEYNYNVLKRLYEELSGYFSSNC